MVAFAHWRGVERLPRDDAFTVRRWRPGTSSPQGLSMKQAALIGMWHLDVPAV